MRKAFLLLVLTCGLAPICQAKEPGSDVDGAYDKGQQVVSPNGKFLLVQRNYDNAAQAHALFLRDNSSGETRRLLGYGRHVEVRWAPDSAAFFVNDFAESDLTNCYIFRLNDMAKFDVLALLKKTEKVDQVKGNHHLFVTCSRWMNENTISILVEGYGAGKSEFKNSRRFDIKAENLLN